MKLEKDERHLDFHDIGLAIKQGRDARGMTQEQLAYIVDRETRSVAAYENSGQHPGLNTFYQIVTMFNISVDQFFFPSQNEDSDCRKRINVMLNSMDERNLRLVELLIKAVKDAEEADKS